MSDTFTRDRFRWLDSLAADPEMTPGDFIVGYAIATTVKRNSGTKVWVSASNDPADIVCEAWLGAREIADKIGMSHGTVFARTQKLEKHGYIQIDPGKPGSGHSHHYRLVEKGQPADHSGKKKGQSADHSKGQPADHTKRSKGQPADHLSPEKVSPLTIKGQPADQNPLYPLEEKTIEEIDSLDFGDEDSGRRSQQKTPAAPDSIDADFAEFYRVYPKHRAKAEALEAYRRARKKGVTPAELLSGAMRAAAEFDQHVRREGHENAHRFTKNAATWLNKECWTDESPPPGGATNGAAPPGQSHHIDVGEQIARQLMEQQQRQKGVRYGQ
jgi:hypothetical protein